MVRIVLRNFPKPDKPAFEGNPDDLLKHRENFAKKIPFVTRFLNSRDNFRPLKRCHFMKLPLA
jgi:hypothetical protein